MKRPANPFQPPPRLANRHLQSIYPSLPMRRARVERRAAPLLAAATESLIDCGQGVRLQAFHSRQQHAGRARSDRLAVLVHGWEGSANSLYILSLGQHLFEHGFDVVRLNLRDHGDTHHLNEELFHSCRIDEVVGAVRRLQLLNPDKSLHLAGFSLGGNFMLRVGARARQASLAIEQIVAVCPVVDPQRTLQELERGWSLYREYFIWKWKRSLRRKQAAWPNVYDFSAALRMRDLGGMTDHLVCTYGDFGTLKDYLDGYALVGDALAGLEVPSRIIAAADDPIIPIEDFSRVAWTPALEITVTESGGHGGYYEGLDRPVWLEGQVLQTFSAPRMCDSQPNEIRMAV